MTRNEFVIQATLHLASSIYTTVGKRTGIDGVPVPEHLNYVGAPVLEFGVDGMDYAEAVVRDAIGLADALTYAGYLQETA